MKAISTVTIIISIIVVFWCTSCSRYKYWATCVNIGRQKIVVSNFKLYNSSGESQVECGGLEPKTHGGSGPYNHKPDKQIIVEWKIMDTGEIVKTSVCVELPAQIANYPINLVFYIDPDNKRVFVAYDYYDVKNSKRMIVDSNGAPFDIAKASETNHIQTGM